MTAVIDTGPAALSPAQRRARWAKIAELDRQIMAARLALPPKLRAAAEAEAGKPSPRKHARPAPRPPARSGGVTATAGLATAAAGAASRGVAVFAGLATASATAAAPVAGNKKARWRARNRQAERERFRAYREEHPRDEGALSRKWRAANPEAAREIARRQTARQQAARREQAAAVAIGANTGPAAGTAAALPATVAIGAYVAP